MDYCTALHRQRRSLDGNCQWCLTKNETVTSFENWRQNLIYTLSLDKNVAPFLVADTWWEKKTKTTPYRGFSDDDEHIPEANRLTKEQKVNILQLLLGQIANYCPTIFRNTTVKNSTSIDQIWQTIRLHYGFQTTGAHFIDFDCIRFDPRPISKTHSLCGRQPSPEKYGDNTS